ncbi:hypothetical protein PMPD1_3112 [Paramixta manurensis]|uniref:Uncharacterized protein n=1 Tax=Paramixta manurensis TaxID=2740817 RepID=A0A6M8UEN6_9GAMM|nr:hypothetical protein PMPD1_3112 [Erwiniaceae bacterium PD-1]
MYQVYLVSFVHSRGAGRIFNYRNDHLPPRIEDIESMEEKIKNKNKHLDGICITAVSRLADVVEIPQEAL